MNNRLLLSSWRGTNNYPPGGDQTSGGVSTPSLTLEEIVSTNIAITPTGDYRLVPKVVEKYLSLTLHPVLDSLMRRSWGREDQEHMQTFRLNKRAPLTYYIITAVTAITLGE